MSDNNSYKLSYTASEIDTKLGKIDNLENQINNMNPEANININDQTPIYTEASSLSELSSGEKLSNAFGKIKKAIKELINHIGNKNNPHEVTAEKINAVKKTGDTMMGNLGLQGDYVRLVLKDSTKGFAYLEKAKDDNGNVALYNERDTDNRSALQLFSENATENGLLRLIVKKNGVSTEHRVLHEGNKSLIIPADIGAATTATYTTTVTTTWTASGNYFYQDIAVSGILGSDNPIVDINPSSDNVANVQYNEEMCKIFRITTTANKITVWATEKPSVAIPIQLKVVR